MNNHQIELDRWKLVVSDLDGTLLNMKSEISPANKAAIKALGDAGIGFTLATGRMDGMTRVYVDQLEITLPVIACNGAIIRDCQTEEIIRSHFLPEEEGRELVAWLSAHRYNFLAYSADVVYYPTWSASIRNFHRYNQTAQRQGTRTIPLETINRLLSKERLQLLKLMVRVNDAHQLDRISEIISCQPGCAAVQSMEQAIDIMARHVSKGQALMELASILGIEPAQIVTLGDNDNDVSMLKESGKSIAMANATSAAKAVSDAQTLHHDKSGFAEAVFQHILHENR